MIVIVIVVVIVIVIVIVIAAVLATLESVYNFNFLTFVDNFFLTSSWNDVEKIENATRHSLAQLYC